LLLVSVTTIPAAGAAAFNVTVPLLPVPPCTPADVNVTPDGPGGCTVNVPVTVPPL
jgi:hypothetical protein